MHDHSAIDEASYDGAQVIVGGLWFRMGHVQVIPRVPSEYPISLYPSTFPSSYPSTFPPLGRCLRDRSVLGP